MVRNDYQPALTGIRAIAAWMVFVHHFIPFSAASNPFLHNLAFAFHIGVSIFFVLSGFLIFYRYQPLTGERAWVGIYLRNRFARIFPLLFVLTLITYVVSNVRINGGPGILPAFLLNITLLNGYFADLKFMGISQAWTLTVEETFYLLAPLIFMIRSRFQLLFVPVVALMVGFLLVLLSRDSYFFGDNHFMLTYTFFGRCTEFCTGVFLGMTFRRDKAPRQGLYTHIGSFLIVVVIVALAFLRTNNPSTSLNYDEIMINNFLLPLCIGIFFYGLLTEPTWLAMILSSRFFNVAGKSSFAFYLIHIGVIQQFLSRTVTGNPVVLFVILNLIAIVLYYIFEKPMQRLIGVKNNEFSTGRNG